jgi:hypothetical protein
LRQLGPQVVVPHEVEPLEPWILPLVHDYPESPYLQGRRLRDLESRMQDIGSGYEPGDVPQTGTPDNPPPGPDMKAVASPATLWPPNGRLVAIAMTITASDDTDAHPTVTLTSVTCDDACVPEADIAGAGPGTDDRKFELRGERKGSGPGRTYTITYSATDASGNESRAVTTVVVPHDRGRN